MVTGACSTVGAVGRLAHHDVLQPLLVVPVGDVGAVVSAPALPALEAAQGDGLSAVQHEAQLQGEDEVGIERLPLVRDGDASESLPQGPDIGQRRLHALLVAEDRQVLVHRPAHVSADAAEHLARAVVVQEGPA